MLLQLSLASLRQLSSDNREVTILIQICPGIIGNYIERFFLVLSLDNNFESSIPILSAPILSRQNDGGNNPATGGDTSKGVNTMNENKYPQTDEETRPGERKELDQRIKWDMPDTGPVYHYHSDSFLLWFLPQFVQHVGEVMVGVSLCRFIELYGNRIPELIQLLFPK